MGVKKKTGGQEESFLYSAKMYNIYTTMQEKTADKVLLKNILILIVSPKRGSIHSRNYSRTQKFTDHFCLNGNFQQLHIDSSSFLCVFFYYRAKLF